MYAMCGINEVVKLVNENEHIKNISINTIKLLDKK